MKNRGKITALIGGCFGSEGKGVISHYLANEYNVHVRVGGPNAGHSFYHAETDRVWKMQTIPCGWVNPYAIIILGRGMLLNFDILVEELKQIAEVDPNIYDRVFIDRKAGVLSQKFVEEEGGHTGELGKRIGSTGEGVGASRRARIQRDPKDFLHADDVAYKYGLQDLLTSNTPGHIKRLNERGANILLEGTQGYGLSMVHGPWPYVTSHDTNAAQLASDVGIAPHRITNVVLVCRTYPIRVGGNSGHLYKELTWEQMAQRLNVEVDDIIERTTVTKKVRRIGEWDERLVHEAVEINAPTSLAIMFLDYLTKKDEGKTEYADLSAKSKKFLTYLESIFDTPVAFAGTGGKGFQVVDLRNQLGRSL